MPETLDADILLLSVFDGRASPEPPPGLLARAAPRKTARGRERDTLFVALGLRSRAAAAPTLHGELAELAATAYFGTPGSVTAALREAVRLINDRLLGHNLRGAAEGRHVQGHLAAAVLRGPDLYLAQCGLTLAMLLRPTGLERFPVSPSRDVKPLGIGQALDVQFSHTQVKAGDVALLSGGPAPGWEKMNLAHYAGRPLEEIQLRLTQSAQGDGALLAIRFEAADATAARRAEPPTSRPTPTPPAVPRPAPTAGVEVRAEPAGVRPAPAPFPEAQREDALRPIPPPIELRPPPAEPQAERPAPPPQPPAEPLPADEPEAGPRPTVRERWRAFWNGAWPRSRQAQAGRGVRAFGRAFGVTLSESFRGLRLLLARTMPEGVLQEDGLFTLPPSVLMGIAVLFPLVVVTVIVVVYFQWGRTEQFRTELALAQSDAAAARAQADDVSARPFWESAVRHLDVAEAYQRTPESFELRRQAQEALDRMDGTLRLTFQPTVLGGLGRDARVTRLLAPDALTLYALDASANAVRRAVKVDEGYEVEVEFECSGGVVGQSSVGALVDLAELPAPNAIGADAVVAMDSKGTLLYCAPGKAALSAQLPPPEPGWQSPRAIAVYADRLYVLDPGANEVWQYVNRAGVFSDSPSRYFASQAHDLRDAMDFVMAGDDLFLLHADGRTTKCTRGLNAAVPDCTSPFPYSDGRPGRQSGPQIDGAAPSSLLYDPPPEPSLYYLDTVAPGGSVYQYSLMLVFQRQFRPTLARFERMDAMAVNRNKQLFVAEGDQVYWAALP